MNGVGHQRNAGQGADVHGAGNPQAQAALSRGMPQQVERFASQRGDKAGQGVRLAVHAGKGEQRSLPPATGPGGIWDGLTRERHIED